MPGPVANPYSRRSLRGGGGASTVTYLPAEGYDGPVPAWPLDTEPSTVELDLWGKLWRTPQAAEWARGGYERLVGRLAMLMIVAEDPSKPSAALLGEVRQLEDRLGLSPMAMRRLSWKVEGEGSAGGRGVAPVIDVERYKNL